jgi:lysophospholipase L1-like esterase
MARRHRITLLFTMFASISIATGVPAAAEGHPRPPAISIPASGIGAAVVTQAPSVVEAKLAVVPSSALVDGQTVQASGSGFAASTQIALSECRTGATSASDCSPAGAIVVNADTAGDFTTPFTVSRMITVGGSPIDCADAASCVLAAGQLPTLQTFAVTPISFVATAANPPPVVTPATRYYLALGDSLATGFGAATGQGYVDDLAAHYSQGIANLQVMNLGCAGETSATFIAGGHCSYPQGSQLAAAEAFLSSHSGQVAFVTIDIGGDDITGCVSSSPVFTISSTCVANATSEVSTDLKTIGQGLRAAAGPSVPIAGMTYFDPFVIEWLTGSSGQQLAEASVADLQQFNASLSAGFATFGAAVADTAGAFSITDFSDLVSSPFGTVPKNVALACTWLLVLCEPNGVGAISIHPNATGYGVIASAFEQVIALQAASPAQPSPPVQPTLALTGFAGWWEVFLGLGLVLLGLALLLGSRLLDRLFVGTGDERPT